MQEQHEAAEKPKPKRWQRLLHKLMRRRTLRRKLILMRRMNCARRCDGEAPIRNLLKPNPIAVKEARERKAQLRKERR
jgi:hypothetical protein